MSAYEPSNPFAFSHETYEAESEKSHAHALPHSAGYMPYTHEHFGTYSPSYLANQGTTNMTAYNGNAGVNNSATAFTAQPITASEQKPDFAYDPRNPSMFSQLGAPAAHSEPRPLISDKHQPLPGLYPEVIEQDDAVASSWQPVASHDSSKLRPGRLHNVEDEEMEEGELDAEALEDGRENNGQAEQGSVSRAIDGESRIREEHTATCHLVQELHSWGLSFQDMLAEVTYPDALRVVFEDLGLPIDFNNLARTEPVTSQYVSRDQAYLNAPAVNPTSQSPTEQQQLTAQPASNEASSASLMPPKSPSKAVSVKQQQPLDRKALIAQKLAAKSMKPRASPSLDLNLMENQNPSGSKLTSKNADPEPGKSSSAAHPNDLSSQTPIGSKSQLEVAREREALRVAQTELARQRIEALKQRHVVKSAVSGQAVSVVKKQKTSSRSPTTPRRTSTNQHEMDSNNSLLDKRPPSNPSGFSTMTLNPIFSIPGLMSEWGTPTPPQEIRSKSGSESEDPNPQHGDETGVEDSQTEKPSISQASSKDTSPRHSPEELDNQMPAIGFSENLPQGDARVVIDISDDDNESPHMVEKNGFGAELDRLATDISGSTPPIVDEALGKFTPLTQTTPTVNQSLNIAGTSSSALATPKRGEREVLTEKQKQIEILHQKIAQLEANSKARRDRVIATRPQDSSLATTSLEMEMSPPRASNIPETVFTHASGAPDQNRDAEEISVRKSSDFTETRPLEAGPRIERVGNNSDTSLMVASESVTQAGDDLSGSGPVKTQEPSLHTARREEIESGIPLLDAEIERTKQRLQILREQEASLEAEIKKGLEGKRMLLEELHRLSKIPGVSETTNHNGNAFNAVSGADMTDHPKPKHDAVNESQGAYTIQAAVQSDEPPHIVQNPMETFQSFSETASLRARQSSDNSISVTPEESPVLSDHGGLRQDDVRVVETAGRGSLDVDVENPIRQISLTRDFENDDAASVGPDRSSPLDSSEAASAVKAASSVDDNNSYEPPNDISSIEASQVLDLEANTIVPETQLVSTPLLSKKISDRSHVDHSGSQQPQSDESDEYEPPESINSMGTPGSKVAAALDQQNLEANTSFDKSKNSDSHALRQRSTYYTPYESPLQHFKQSESFSEPKSGVDSGSTSPRVF